MFPIDFEVAGSISMKLFKNLQIGLVSFTVMFGSGRIKVKTNSKNKMGHI